VEDPNLEINQTQPGGSAAPASLPVSGYKLDWADAEIKLGKGRFVHTLRRPDAELLIARDGEIKSEIPIGTDGSYALPDTTEIEEIDARYHDKLLIQATGYAGDIPARHKAAAFNGLYRREADIEDDVDLFAETITVTEEIGSGDEPDFVVRHVMRQPSESELRKFRQRSNGGYMKPGKRGKQKFVPNSTLRLAIQYYDLWLVSIDGAHVSGKTYTEDLRAEFLHNVDPLVKKMIVTTLVSELSSSVLD